jgi:hypothetical protein
MATQKKKAASKTTLAGIQKFKTDKTVEFNEAAHHAREAKKPTKAPKVKPAKLDPALSAARGVPTETPKAKRTVAAPKRLVSASGLPEHSYHDVASLAQVLGTFPRGSTLDIMDNRLDVYNLRGRLIGQVRQGDKPKKTARADKL